jgi:hypothetical protein
MWSEVQPKQRISAYAKITRQKCVNIVKVIKSRKVIMSLGVAKEYDLHEVRWAGSAHPAESEDNLKGKKMGAKARGTFLYPFEVCPSSESTTLIQG